MRPTKPPHFFLRRISSIGIIAVLFLGFMLVLTAAPVHASNAAVIGYQDGGTQFGHHYSITIDVANPGDTIVIAFSGFNAHTNATYLHVGVSDGFGAPILVAKQFTYNPGTTCAGGANICAVEGIDYITNAPSGDQSITLNFTNGGTQSGLTVYDTAGLGAVYGSDYGYCPTSGFCGSSNVYFSGGEGAVPGFTIPTGGLAITSGSFVDCNIDSNGNTAGTGYSNAFQVNEGTGYCSGVSSYSTSGYTNPTFFPWAQDGTDAYYGVGVVFATGGIQTTVVNTGCIGACLGANNGTAHYLTSKYLYFYNSQNAASPALIDNITLDVAAVHINTASTNLYLVCYAVANTNLPSAGSPFVITTGDNPQIVPLYNSTTNQAIVANPQCPIAASVYYAVGFMVGSTASRGSGASGSGVAVYEVSNPTTTPEYKYNVGASTPPASFYSSTTSLPYDFMFANSLQTIATITLTSYSTVAGTATTTTTFTETTYATDAAATSEIWANVLFIYMILFLIPLAFVAIGATTGNGSVILVMFVGGLTLSSMIAIAAQILPPPWLVLIGMVDLLCLLLAWRGR